MLLTEYVLDVCLIKRAAFTPSWMLLRCHEVAMVANTMVLYLLLHGESSVDASPRSLDAHGARREAPQTGSHRWMLRLGLWTCMRHVERLHNESYLFLVGVLVENR
jgi:hypothetical protein